jgi:hypothetical protein
MSIAEAPGTQARQASGQAWRILLAVELVLCLLHAPVFLGQIVFLRDVAHYLFPLRWLLRDSFLRGELPEWNPLQALGFPVFGNPQYGVFYPPNWLYLLVPRTWVGSMVTWQDLLHLLWGSAGIFLLARRFRVSPVAAAIAALAWGLSGYTTAQWASGMRMLAGSWLPWIAVGHLALLDSLQRNDRGWLVGVVKAALPTACALLLGELFVAMMGVGFALATVAVVGIIERGQSAPARFPRRRLGAFALALALAVGTGAVVLIPAHTLVASTERAEPLRRADAEGWSLHPLRMFEFVAPGSMGNSDNFAPTRRWIGDARLDHLPLSFSMYLGASVVALALAAFGRRRALASALACCAGFALLLAFGQYLPVHGWFRRLVPPMAYMRFPEKYTVLFVAWTVLLAALGVERILSGQRQPWRRNVILLGLVLGSAAGAHLMLPAGWARQVAAGALHGAAGVGCVLAIQFLAGRRPRLAAWLLVVSVTADLAVATLPLLSYSPRLLAVATPPAARVVLADNAGRGAPPRLYRANNALVNANRFAPPLPPSLGELWLLQTLITNMANTWGVATVPGYDAAIPAAFDGIWESGLAEGQSVLRLFGVRYAVLPVDDPRDPKERRTGIEPMLDPLPGTRLYRVPGALPRVFLAGQAQVADDAAALRSILDPAIVAGSTAWLAPASGVQPLVGPAGSPPGTCVLDSYSNNRLQASCQVERPALAVFVEQYEKGWSATLDGHPAPILRANLIMRAVAVGPGSHRIAMEFRTPGLRVGALVTLLSLLVLLGLVVLRLLLRLRAHPRTRS